jgi:hydrogenase-4 membrane subunit HyfE
MEDEAHDLRTVVILIVNHEEIFQQIGGVDIQIEVTYDVEATFSLLQGGTDELVENGVSFEVLFAFVGVLVVVGFLILDLEDVVHGHNQLLNAVIAIGKDLLPSCSAKILPM